MSTQYACPSPKGSNGAGLYLTKAGTLVDRHGRNWGASSIRKMAMDQALPGPEWNERSEAVHPRLTKLMAELKSLVEKGGLPTALHKKLVETLAHHVGELGRADGAGATDDEDPDGLAEFRKHLAAKGLNADEIEEACKYAKRDYERGEAEDVIPHNALGGRLHGRTGSGTIRPDSDADMEVAYPGIANVMADNYGTQPEPPRHLSGGGIVARVGSRPMAAGDSALATDEDIEQQIEREYGRGPGIGMFGR